MSEAAVVLATSATRARAALRSEAVAAAIALGIVVGLALATWGTWGDLDSDTGLDAVVGARIVDGDVPYRDFIYYYGPLAPTLIGITAVFGTTLAPFLVLGSLITLAILGATYTLARIVTNRLGAVLATAIAAAVALTPDNYNYVLPHTHAATLGTLLVLLELLAIWRFAVTERALWAIAVGGCAGFAALTKPEPAFAAFLCAAVWLALRPGTRGGDVLRVGAPALAIPLMVYGALAAAVGTDRLVLDNLYPVDVLNAGGDVELRGRMPLTLPSFVELAGNLALYAVGVAALAALGYTLGRDGRLRQGAIAAGIVAALGAAAAAAVNPEALRHGLQYAYGWIPAGAAIVVCALFVGRRRRADMTPSDQVAFALTAALLALAATTYPGFFPHAPHEQMAAYYIPLAAIFLAWLHLRIFGRTRTAAIVGAAWLGFLALAGTGLAVKDARDDSVTVSGPGGTLRDEPAEAALYAGALGWIERETRPGDPIFVAPLMTNLYLLSQRASVLDELAMIPNALPDEADERRAIADLDAAGVRLVITDDRKWPGYGHGAFGETFDMHLAAWLTQKFDRAATLAAPAHTSFEGFKSDRTISVWIRRNS